MNKVEFESAARLDGRDDIGVRELPEASINEVHTHHFEATGLILRGAFTITVDGTATTYSEGMAFAVSAGCPHQETVPAGGVEVMYAYRHPS